MCPRRTRRILEASKGWDAAATFRAQCRLHELARQAGKVWREIEVMLLPTTPRIYTVAEVLDRPYQTNATLGRYTNFMNLLDLAAVYRMFAIPAAWALAPRPALIRDEARGAAIEVEVWELSPAAFGDFVSKIPGPLGIGKVLLENGEELPGFIAAPRAAEGRRRSRPSAVGRRGWRVKRCFRRPT